MEDAVKAKVQEIFTTYLKENNLHRTPERFQILEAVYSQKGPVSMEDIVNRLEEKNFHVSRATLYNTMNLLQRMRLVEKYNLQGGIKYILCYEMTNRCLQICTVCGKETELNLRNVVNSVKQARLKRFTKEGFSLYIYGVCSACKAKQNRKNNSQNNKN